MTETGGGWTTDANAEDAAVPESSASNMVTLPDGHVVTLHPRVTTAIAVGVLSAASQGAPSVAVLRGLLADVYLDLSILSWTYADDITPETIRKNITVANGAVDVAEAADNLYQQEIVDGPLAQRLRLRSLGTPTASSTLPTSASGSTNRTRPARSSRNGTGGKLSAVRGR